MGELYLDNIERQLDISHHHAGRQESPFFERIEESGSYQQFRATGACYLEREDLKPQERS